MKKAILGIVTFLTISFANGQEIKRWRLADLENYMKNSDSSLIINFWATFCAPCVEEIPYFQQLVKKYQKEKIKLILASLDFADFYPKRIATFASKNAFTSQIVWMDEDNPNNFTPWIDSSWSGVLPATLFYNPKSGYRRFYEEQMTPEQVEGEIINLTNYESTVPLPVKAGYMSDYNNDFSQSQQEEIDKLVKEFEAKTGKRLAVLTTNDYSPFETLFEYSYHIAKKWGIGTKENKGILIVFGSTIRKIWIQNGYSGDKTLKDQDVKKIIDRDIVPLFKKDLYFEGLKKGIQALTEKLSEAKEEAKEPK